MPWKEVSQVSVREEFVVLAGCEGANVSAVCRRFGISRKTGYKWLSRYARSGRAGLVDRPRRPRCPAGQTGVEMERRVVELRREHPAWGGRKLRRWLLDRGVPGVPSASTLTEILRRQGLLEASSGAGRPRSFERFEHACPNDLWQMDFKGHFALTRGGRCHPLTVLDDHSRYAVGLRACRDERTETVQWELGEMFRQHGMPHRMLMDNGSPWGDEGGQPWTRLTVWLLRLGVSVSHGRPFHPQTQGKDERFHRTLMAEVLRGRSFTDVADSQRAFDPWRVVYNTERPHEALGLCVPASRYRPSGRAFPEALPAVEYGPGVLVRKVGQNGLIKFQKRTIRVGKAFAGERVGLEEQSGSVYRVFYCHQCVGTVELGAESAEVRLLVRARPSFVNSGESSSW